MTASGALLRGGWNTGGGLPALRHKGNAPYRREGEQPSQELVIDDFEPHLAQLGMQNVKPAQLAGRRRGGACRAVTQSRVNVVLALRRQKLVSTEERRQLRIPFEIPDVVQAPEPVTRNVARWTEYQDQTRLRLK